MRLVVVIFIVQTGDPRNHNFDDVYGTLAARIDHIMIDKRTAWVGLSDFTTHLSKTIYGEN